jgi:hypothetical protein
VSAGVRFDATAAAVHSLQAVQNSAANRARELIWHVVLPVQVMHLRFCGLIGMTGNRL